MKIKIIIELESEADGMKVFDALTKMNGIGSEIVPVQDTPFVGQAPAQVQPVTPKIPTAEEITAEAISKYWECPKCKYAYMTTIAPDVCPYCMGLGIFK